MKWLKRLLSPRVEQERADVQQAAQAAIEAADDTVVASKQARKRVLELELQLRKRAR